MKALLRIAVALACAVAISASISAQMGQARLAGKVVDESGKPVQDAMVKATMQSATRQAKSNKKGEWNLNGLATGTWTIEVTKDGFAPVKSDVEVAESERVPTLTVTLAKPKADPNVEIQAEAQKAAQLFQAGKPAEARAVYEQLLAKYPEFHQVHPFIARTYAAEGNNEKALEHLKIAMEKEPDNVDVKLLTADLLMEKGEKVEAQKILDTVDLTQVKDPFTFINVAITKINDGQTDEAIALLDKLAAQFPNQAQVYYYRGRAKLAAKQMPEGKADLEKFVSMAPPDARELPDAKKLLEQLKDIK